MSILNHGDFFDFPGYEKQLNSLERLLDRFGQSQEKWLDRLKNSNDQLRKNAIQTTNALRGLDVMPGDSVTKLKELGSELDRTGTRIKQNSQYAELLTSTYNANKHSIDQLKGVMKELEKQYNQLDPKSENFASDQKRIADQVKATAGAITLQSTVLKAAKTQLDSADRSYTKLSQQTNELRKNLRNLPDAFNAATGAINLNNRQAVLLQEQIQKNDKALKAMDATMGVHTRNVGNYKSALEGIRSQLVGAAAGYLSVDAVIRGIAGGIEIIDTMHRQEVALKNASSSTVELNKNLSTARQLAKSYGVNLNETTDAIRKFTGATRGTAIEGDKARRVFTAFTANFAANGASAEELSRAMKALGDMMSKGTIQAEELKGQLGDAMPGAMKTFADAMGVSQRELMKMMENGELLAEDVLPKVAAELEKITGNKAQENLKTISGSWQVVKTNFQLFLAEFNKTGAVSNFFAVLNGNIAKTFEVFRLANKYGGTKGILEMAGRATVDMMTFNTFGLANTSYQQLASREAREQRVTDFAGSSAQDQEKFIKTQTRAIEVQRTRVADLQKTVDKLQKGYKDTWNDGGKSYRIWSENINKARKDLAEAKSTLDSYSNGLIKANRIHKEMLSKIPALGKPLDKTTPDKLVSSIRDQIDAIPNALIGKNGKAELTKDQAKALRGAREEVLQLYNTLSKGDVARLNLSSLKTELNELLYGKKTDNSGKKAAAARQKEIRDQFKLIEGYVKDAQEELQKNILGADNDDLLESLRERLKKSIPGIEAELTKGNQKAKSLLKKIEETFRNKIPWLKPMQYDTDTVLGQALKDGEKFRKFIQSGGFLAAVRKIQKDLLGDYKTFEENAKTTILPGGGLSNRLSKRSEQQATTYMEYQQESGQLNRELDSYIFLKEAERNELQSHLKQVYQWELAGKNDRAKLARDEYEYKKHLIEEEARRRQESLEQGIQLAAEFGSAIFEINNAYRDRDLANLDKQKSRELELAGDNKDAQKRIEEEFSKQQSEIRMKQARADRAAALLQIVANTAIAVSKAIAQFPITGGQPFAGYAIAQGAIQAALVLAKPLPAYAVGTKNAPEGPALVGEKGPELRKSQGKYFYYDRPTVAHLNRGDTIYTAAETQRILHDAQVNGSMAGRLHQARLGEAIYVQQQSSTRIDERAIGAAVGEQIADLPIHETHFDERGVQRFIRRKNTRTRYLNDRFNLR
ncbi:hypothetical protein BWI93_00960 [Siphonobacter sp. BAB-5385]|uniref:tape measure protein n=1 Tax=Siphonobacter sp. BAB-5385 TaxID=1864822 RepID=UPI000B9E5FEA|nr:tape measure protein [Siphonobacter sp. BAB-5385]OZI09940.1 hypothetical protein BWI93_00960 [Siphonobacter sp. BAB-5385]